VIRPEKHLDLRTCVIQIAAVILEDLCERRVVRFVELQQRVQTRLGNDADVHFLPALDLLFLLGRVEYLPHRDVVEYISPGSTGGHS
jgi:hypothetical protein